MSNSNQKIATAYIPQAFDPSAIRVVRNPAEAAEAARVLAFEKGYNDGLDQARQAVEEATTESNKRVRRAIASLRGAIDQLDQREATSLTDIEDELVRAAFAIARAVVQRELQLTNDPGAEAVARAIQLAPTHADVIARLNPEDAATLNVDSIPTSNRNLTFVADPSIEPGGCIVDSGKTSIDGQFSSIFANVWAALGFVGSMPEALDGSALNPSEGQQPESGNGAGGPNSQIAAPGSSASESRTTASEAPLS